MKYVLGQCSSVETVILHIFFQHVYLEEGE
jgi:hypothetical protein